MTNAELLAKIKAEIERRKSLLTQHSKLTYDLILETFIKEYDDLLSFLSTLESEKPMNLDELVKEAQRYYSDNFAYITSDQPTLSILTNIARHFAQWGAERQKEQDDRLVDIIYQQGIEKGKDEMRKTLKRKEKK